MLYLTCLCSRSFLRESSCLALAFVLWHLIMTTQSIVTMTTTAATTLNGTAISTAKVSKRGNKDFTVEPLALYKGTYNLLPI